MRCLGQSQGMDKAWRLEKNAHERRLCALALCRACMHSRHAALPTAPPAGAHLEEDDDDVHVDLFWPRGGTEVGAKKKRRASAQGRAGGRAGEQAVAKAGAGARVRRMQPLVGCPC